MSFDQHERQILERLADVLIPAADGMPSASQAGVADKWLDAVLAARPDLASGLKSLLAAAADQSPAPFVEQLQSNNADAFGILAEVTAAAYFMNPEVLAAIGYAGQAARPLDPHPDYLDDGLLDSVISRGLIYRPTPNNR